MRYDVREAISAMMLKRGWTTRWHISGVHWKPPGKSDVEFRGDYSPNVAPKEAVEFFNGKSSKGETVTEEKSINRKSVAKNKAYTVSGIVPESEPIRTKRKR